MKLVNGYISYSYVSENSLLLATTNNVCGRNGLVMGAGNAKAMKTSWPNAPKEFGDLCKGDYGLVIIEQGNGFIGAFQTKRHWRRKSSYDLIEYSVRKLMEVCDDFEIIRLPYPGINHGGLDKMKVLDIIHVLPDNVIVHI